MTAAVDDEDDDDGDDGGEEAEGKGWGGREGKAAYGAVVKAPVVGELPKDERVLELESACAGYIPEDEDSEEADDMSLFSRVGRVKISLPV